MTVITWGPFLESPEKPFVKLRPAYCVKQVFSYVEKGIKIKITAKFRASRTIVLKIQRELCRPKSFGTSRNRSLRPVSRKSRTFRVHFGWHSSLCIFKTKASQGTKLCSYFNFSPFTTYEKTSFTEWASRSFRNGFPGPKSSRDFRETGHWLGSLGQNVWDILVKVGHHTVKVTLRY